MSEDVPPPEPEAAPPPPDAAPADARPGDAAPADANLAPSDGKPASLAGGGTALPPRSLRIPILGAIAIVVILAVVVLVARGRRHRDPGAPLEPGSTGGAAISAPAGPALPDEPVTGVRLTGFVIDGAGIPVAGAEVSAELEKGAPDRALAPTPRTGNGSGVGNGVGNGTGIGSGNGVGGGNGVGNGTGIGSGNGVGNGTGTGGDGVGIGTGIGGGNGVGNGTGAGSASPAKIVVARPTGADGRFVVDGLEPGRYRVRVTGAGLLPAEVRFVPVPSDATRILVSRQIAIEGLVTDGGKPAPNITVAVRGDAIGGELDMKSGPDGKFTFSNLPEGRYQVFAWQGALAARALRVSRLGAGPFTPVELRLEPAAIVVGRVIDRDEGTGIAAAIELRPSGDDQAPRYARSGPDGAFKIEGVPDGTWIADAFSPGYVSPGGVELAAGRGITELALGRGATIEGKIVDAEGKPIAGAEVRAITAGTSPVESSAAVDQDRLRRFSGRMAAPAVAAASASTADPALIPRGELGVMVGPIPPLPAPGAQVALSAVVDPISVGLAGEPAPLGVDLARASVWVTGADGVYRIRGLGRGKVSVLAVAPGYAEGRSKERELESGQTLTKVDVVLSPGTFLVGKVTDQHGVPVIGAQVTAKPELGAPIDAFTDEAGGYRLGPVGGKIDLHATAYGHGAANRSLDLAPVKGVVAAEQTENLVLSVADAILAGVLDDASGAPVAAATIEIIGGAADGRHAVVGTDGTFTIDALPAGAMKIRVRHPDYPAHDFEVTAGDGKQRARLRLPIGGAVEGAALEAASGAPLTGISITATGPGGATAEATTDKTGRFKLGPLEPGTWKLVLAVPGFLPVTRSLDVAAGRAPGATTVRDVRLEAARGALLGGTVRDGRGQRLANTAITVTSASGASTTGTSDGNGEFRIRDCPTGEIEIHGVKDDLRGGIRATVRGGDEILGLSLELVR